MKEAQEPMRVAGCIEESDSRPRKLFLLSKDSSSPSIFDLAEGESLFVGRAPYCELVIHSAKVSNRHLELFMSRDGGGELCLLARDVSTNGAGGRVDAGAEFIEIDKKAPWHVQHGSEIIVPLRTAPGQVPSLRDALVLAEQARLTVRFPDSPSAGLCAAHAIAKDRPLPDIFCDSGGVQTGRWRYLECLGEGGLGVVWFATDMTGPLGNVAIKVSKWSAKTHGSRAAREAWQVYIMHREAQWSLQYLHKSADARYDAQHASLFVRYLEDHTGFPAYESPHEFDAVRGLYEQPELEWSRISFDPALPDMPYVVMELAHGQAVTRLTNPESMLDAVEQGRIVEQSSLALGYLGKYGLIHRDFRGSNMHISRRGAAGRIKVLDLGLVINADNLALAGNPNAAVKACWNRRSRLYDWVPPECKQKDGPLKNFASPLHSFDAYSLAVLILRIFGGKAWARKVLESGPSSRRWKSKLQDKGLSQHLALLNGMLGEPKRRPAFVEIAEAFSAGQKLATAGGDRRDVLKKSKARKRLAPGASPKRRRLDDEVASYNELVEVDGQAAIHPDQEERRVRLLLGGAGVTQAASPSAKKVQRVAQSIQQDSPRPDCDDGCEPDPPSLLRVALSVQPFLRALGRRPGAR